MTLFKKINILSADSDRLKKISKDFLLALNLDEMQAIKKYFSGLKRNPTDIELETIAQTWSEHCKHKTLTGSVEYTENGKKELIQNLLKDTIAKATNKLAKPWCLSVFKDNAGIIEFDKNWGIAFKVETHNHPSAIEPYGGAGTGIGGVIRDILGAGLGAKPILNTDVFCFGLPNTSFEDLPSGVLHPKRILKGVVAGVRDYGNRMGIPTSNGAVYFDEGYTCNPLVYCGTVGIIPQNKCFKNVKPGFLIVAVGGKTGRDGIHGATFSSLSLKKDIESSVVQIGNPIVEKKVLDTILQARDKNLYSSITDCGAGGFSSAVGELGEECGAVVFLERAPLKYKGLLPWEIWLSESQERMVLAVSPKKIKALMKIFESEDVEATVIGKFTKDRKLTLYYKGVRACQLDMKFLHNGVPKVKKIGYWNERPKKHSELVLNDKKDYLTDVYKLFSDLNIASKEWIIRQYDHEVQGTSVVKPLVGIDNDGPSDACVIRPLLDNKKGIVVSNGMNPRYGQIDAYDMAASAIDEALRNIVAAGGNLEKCAILDNFAWGSVNDPKQVGNLVRACKACYDMSIAFEVPFISGKDSLNNEYVDQNGKRVSIPDTLLISAISVLEDIKYSSTLDFKRAGNLLYILGITRDELGGSAFYYSKKIAGGNTPKVYPLRSREIMQSLSHSIKKGLVDASHDCSEGGMIISVIEMAFSGGFGAEIDLSKIKYEGSGEPQNHTLLFSESNGRFIVEIEPKNKSKFESIMAKCPVSLIGKVIKQNNVVVYGLNGRKILDGDLKTFKKHWQKPLNLG